MSETVIPHTLQEQVDYFSNLPTQEAREQLIRAGSVLQACAPESLDEAIGIAVEDISNLPVPEGVRTLRFVYEALEAIQDGHDHHRASRIHQGTFALKGLARKVCAGQKFLIGRSAPADRR